MTNKILHFLGIFLFIQIVSFGQIEFYLCYDRGNLRKATLYDDGSCDQETISISTSSCLDLTFHPNGNLYLVQNTNNVNQLYLLDLDKERRNLVSEYVLSDSQFINSLISDSQGNFYGAATNPGNTVNSLYKFYITGEIQRIGELPFTPLGDLFFYNGKLYCTGKDEDNRYYIYLINIESTSNSSQIALIGNNIQGSAEGASVYFDECNSQRIFYFETSRRIVEFDIENSMATEVCTVNPPISGMTIWGDFYASECFDCDDLEVLCNKTPPSCYEYQDGQIELIVKNGKEPYEFKWDDGSTSNILNGIESGIHSVIVSDANGCVRKLDVELPEAEKILLSIEIINPISCYNGTDGALQAVLSPNDNSYLFNWNDGNNTGEVFTGLDEGLYFVEATNGDCFLYKEFFLNQPEQIKVTFETTPDNGSCNGTLEFIIEGGQDPYQTFWNPPIDLEENLCAGVYDLTVVDSNNCSERSSVTIDQISNTNSLDRIAFNLFPNPVIDILQIQSNSSVSALKIYNTNGETIKPNAIQLNPVIIDVSNLNNGLYFITMTTKSGKRLIKFYKI
jgi:hypothetical protein